MHGEIVEVRRDVVRRPRVKQPVCSSIRCIHSQIGLRLPWEKNVGLLLIHEQLSWLVLRASSCTVTLCVTQLALPKIGLECACFRSVGRSRILPIRIIAEGVGVVVVSPVVVVAVVVVVGLIAMLNCIRRGGNNHRGGVFAIEKLGFVVEKSLMYLWNTRGSVFAFDLINHVFVFFRKPSKYDLNLILMIVWLSKDGKLIKLGYNTLDILIDCLVTFGEEAQLISELFYMSPTRFCVCFSKPLPDLSSSGGSRDYRLD